MRRVSKSTLRPQRTRRETWQSTIRHIALEGRCFVLTCNQFMTKAEYPDDLDEASLREVAAMPDPLTRGGSAMVEATGRVPGRAALG